MIPLIVSIPIVIIQHREKCLTCGEEVSIAELVSHVRLVLYTLHCLLSIYQRKT